MKKNSTPKYLIMILLTATFAVAQTKVIKKVPVRPTVTLDGKTLFSEYCAVCHGPTGKGDGPAADALKRMPPDLTEISHRNGGKFPDFKVLETLKNGPQISAHGTQEMPIWGTIFSEMSNNPSTKQMRINSLLNYIQDMQTK